MAAPTLRPLSCAVHWTLGDGTFSGSATWTIALDEPATEVKLHAELPLDSMRVVQYKKSVKIAQSERLPDGQLTLRLAEPLQVGRAELCFAFTGKIEGTVGIHYSGLKSPVVQTHFEVSHARKALPCFDLTHIKAAYKVTVTVKGCPPTTTAFSNMPLAAERAQGGAKTFEFQETPPIPAYVLAFAVFPVDITTIAEEVELPGGSLVSVSAHIVPNPKYPLDTVLKAAKLGLQLCSEWLCIDYPLPKLDVVVVPKLCLGGMENHGLVFLDGQETTPGKGKKAGSDSLIELLMHEIAHMWMGNMVGFDFWVKEGLAQFFEKVLADAFLGRSSSLPSDSKVTLADVKAVAAPASADAAPPAPAGKAQSSKSKKKGKAAKDKKEDAISPKAAQQDTDAVDNHDVFNGNMYTKSYLWTVGVERGLGRMEFMHRLSKLLADNVDLFVPEDAFLTSLGQS